MRRARRSSSWHHTPCVCQFADRFFDQFALCHTGAPVLFYLVLKSRAGIYAGSESRGPEIVPRGAVSGGGSSDLECGSGLWVYPHSIAYFNEPAAVLPTSEDRHYPRPESPLPFRPVKRCAAFLMPTAQRSPPSARFQVDWNQDFYRLLAWCRNHLETHGKITVDDIGNWVGRSSIPQTIPKHSEETELRWYAVSVNRLYGGKLGFPPVFPLCNGRDHRIYYLCLMSATFLLESSFSGQGIRIRRKGPCDERDQKL